MFKLGMVIFLAMVFSFIIAGQAAAQDVDVDIYVNLQGDNRPASGWEVPLTVCFCPVGSGTETLLNPGTECYCISGTTVYVPPVGEAGTRAMLNVGVIDVGTYDITVDSTTTLMNVKRNVVIEKSWGMAELIETGTDNSWYPHVALDSSGNAIAVWEQNDSGIYDNIYSNRYVAGTGWGMEELIETNNSGDVHQPKVAVDGSGNAIAVWYQYDGFRDNIWANRYVFGIGWETAELIETGTGGAWYPEVAADNEGNAIAVWYQDDGARYGIWSNRYSAGTGWGTAEPIDNNTGGAALPQVVVDNSGNATAVWEQHDGIRNNIWSNRYTAGIGWGTAELIESGTGGARYPQIAADSGGNAVVVWQQGGGIWSNRYIPETGWDTAELIESSSEQAQLPQVAISSSGNAVSVWYQYDGIRNNIWSNRYTAGTGWGTAELIESGTGDAKYPQIAADSGGNAVVVWQDYDGIDKNIWSNRYIIDSGWDAAELIETNDYWAYSPQIAVNSEGNAIAVWYQSDLKKLHIWSNRYE